MTFYTNGTKDCREFEEVLKKQNISYTINTDIEEMKDKAILALPAIEVDGRIFNTAQSMAYLRGLQCSK